MITLKVEGMSSKECVVIITQAVLSVDKEAGVQVDLSQGLVNVQTHAQVQAIRSAIEENGYEVLRQTLSAPM
jgi:copper chaperone